MKSPFTGGKVSLEAEYRQLEYRKESFKVLYNYYVCEDTGEQFTDTELDTLNLNQVYNQYRTKYGLPFIDEIKSIREYYGLSAAKMSEVLGLGANVYRAYESGEMPSIATGRLIQLAKDPVEFKKLLLLGRNEFEQHDFERVLKKIEHAMSGWSAFEEMYEERILGPKTPNVYNGYRVPDIERVGGMVQYFAKKVKPYKTMLNKLMFYADFLHFRRTSYGISGITYKAIQHGPVPANYGGIYDTVVERKYANVNLVDFGTHEGEQFYVNGNVELSVEDGIFSPTEIKAIEDVAKFLGNLTTKQIVEKSHEEHAWQLNVDEFSRINYEYGFFLKYIE